MTTIDKEQLANLLAERLDMDQKDADQQLVKLIDYIQQLEAENDTFDIGGFGTFKTIRDRLEFVPSDVLATEINNKYAGMKPIELIGAFKVPDGEAAPAAGSPEKGRGAEAPSGDHKKPPAPGVDSDTSEKAVPETAPPPPSDEKAPAGREGEGEEEEKAVQPEPNTPREDSAEKAERLAVPASGVKESPAASAGSLADDPLGKAIVIIVVILTLAVAAWLAYDLGLFGSDAAGTGSSLSPKQPAGQQHAVLWDSVPAEEVEKAGFLAGQPDRQGEPGNETSVSPVVAKAFGWHGEPNREVSGGPYPTAGRSQNHDFINRF